MNGRGGGVKGERMCWRVCRYYFRRYVEVEVEVGCVRCSLSMMNDDVCRYLRSGKVLWYGYLRGHAGATVVPDRAGERPFGGYIGGPPT